MTTSGIADHVRVSVQLSASEGNHENDKTNLPRSFSLSMTILQTFAKVVRSLMEIPKSAEQFNFNVGGKHCENKEPARTTYKYYSGDQCHHPQCWMNKNKDRLLEVLLMASAFLLSFATAGAFYFNQALTAVGGDNPVLKNSLAMFNWVFAASFFCNFLGVLMSLILQSRREYHPFKKLSLMISNTASFLLMVVGYGFVIAFNIQHV